ncbi:hypothetical protein ED733_003601 [Metarhizium rileyi]|uniref:Mitochondrial division protein 1 n=1 Tax=Metarhizium rileyi (strain RCEF 4871) TaxID=1649241 RepID=A0A5C6G6K2_METRR|nr:hypothetical protein ED733_003601 [Metarhizium rileyi]
MAEDRIFQLSLTRRYQRASARTEITCVGMSPTSSTLASAFSISATPNTGQSWVELFELSSQKAYIKAAGSHAALGPTGAGKSRVATIRDWALQVGQGVQYHHGSTVLVRDFSTGNTVVELKEAVTQPVVWSRDGIAIAAGEGNGRMGVWDARTGARVGRVVSHIDKITHAAFMPDHQLVTLSRDGTVRISDPKTAKTVSKLEIEGSGSTNPRLLAVCCSGRTIVSLWGTTVHIWLPQANHLTSYNLNTTRATEGWPLCISPDTRWMLSRTEYGFDVTDVASGTIAWENRENGGVDSMITAASISKDSKVVLLGRLNGSVEVWDLGEERVVEKPRKDRGRTSWSG